MRGKPQKPRRRFCTACILATYVITSYSIHYTKLYEIPTLLWANLTNSYIWIAVFVTIGYGGVGFYDDYKKVIRRDAKGLSAMAKFASQILLAGVAATLIYMDVGIQDKVSIPFFKKLNPGLGIAYIPFVILVIVGASNAVNLTDGLDGLAIGPSIIAAGTYMLFAYLTGHVKIANYLQIPYVAGVITSYSIHYTKLYDLRRTRFSRKSRRS